MGQPRAHTHVNHCEYTSCTARETVSFHPPIPGEIGSSGSGSPPSSHYSLATFSCASHSFQTSELECPDRSSENNSATKGTSHRKMSSEHQTPPRETRQGRPV